MALALLAALIAVVAVTSTVSPHRRRATRSVRLPAAVLFAADSIWNAPLTSNAPIDPSSGRLISALDAEVQSEIKRGIGPWIATTTASTPLYQVPADQPRVRVTLDAPADIPGRGALQAALDAVPIPPGATPAAGADRHMTIWQPATDTLWELFKAVRQPGGWSAEWGGAIRDVSRNPGYYGPSAWPGATTNWGSTATSLSVIGGTILLSDIQAGRIDHALALALPAPRRGVFAWPAQRSDGTGGPDTLPEGARLRLNPRLDLQRIPMPPFLRMIAEAAQRYGLIVRDQTHDGISLFAQDPTSLPTNPYYGRDGAYDGLTPLQLLERFPWDQLEVVKMQLCTAAPCAAGTALAQELR